MPVPMLYVERVRGRRLSIRFWVPRILGSRGFLKFGICRLVHRVAPRLNALVGVQQLGELR